MANRPYPFIVRYKGKLYKLFYGKFVECDSKGRLIHRHRKNNVVKLN